MAALALDLAARLARPLRLLAVGDELLRGEVLDTNSHWLAGRLTALAWTPDTVRQCGDRAGELAGAVRAWLGEGGALIVSGGLGPTPDDRSREEIAAGLGVALAESAEAAALIRAREERLERRFTAYTHRQALLPAGMAPIANPVGTAPGFWCAHPGGRGCLLVLPGVPHEYRAILEALLPLPAGGQGENWRLTGLGEDQLSSLLADLPGVETLGFYPSLEGLRLRLPAAGGPDREALAARLGPHLVSRTNEGLEAALIARLAAAGQTLAVAESCTGGLLAARLTRVPGASAVFLGGVLSYADSVKRALLGVPAALLASEGAVSEAVARAMAEGARARLASDWALAITGIAGPGGERPGKPVGTLHIGLAGPQGTRHRHRLAGWAREENRQFAVQQALDLLWGALQAEGERE